MKVILQQDVKGLGKKGAMVEVADGYGRNYLLPRGLAAQASAGAVRALQEIRKNEEAKLRREVDQAQGLKDKLQGTLVTVRARVGEGGRLFGSVTNKDIAEALQRQCGLTLDRKKVELKEAIRTLGTHVVTVRLGHEMVADVQVQIVAET